MPLPFFIQEDTLSMAQIRFTVPPRSHAPLQMLTTAKYLSIRFIFAFFVNTNYLLHPGGYENQSVFP